MPHHPENPSRGMPSSDITNGFCNINNITLSPISIISQNFVSNHRNSCELRNMSSSLQKSPSRASEAATKGKKTSREIKSPAPHPDSRKFKPMHLSEKFLDDILRNKFNSWDKHSIEYEKFFFNHSTHLVVALAGLKEKFPDLWETDEGQQRLVSYCHYYESKLESPGKVISQDLSKLQEQGDDYLWKNLSNTPDTNVKIHDKYATVLEYLSQQEGDKNFMDWKQKPNTKMLLNKYLPHQIHCLGSHAFHGLIEIGWRIEGGFSLAPGLAHLIVRGLDLGQPADLDDLNEEDNADPQKIVARISKDKQFDHFFDGAEGFTQKMRLLADSPEVLNKYDIFVKADSSLDELQDFCEELNEMLYILFTTSTAKGNFFLLHTITALHAAREVLTMLDGTEHRVQLVRNFWRAILAAYCVLDRPQPDKNSPPNEVPEDWSSNKARAEMMEHIDLHWHKLFHVSLCTEKRAPKLGSLMREAVDLYYHKAKKDQKYT